MMHASIGEPRTMWRRLAALLTTRRMRLWGTGLLLLTLFLYVYAMSTRGYVDRAGRFKGSDYVQFYVMGSMVLEGRTDALYDAESHLADGRRLIDPKLGLYATHPNYGPQVAAAFAPLALLPFGLSLALFLAIMTTCYASGVWLVWRESEGLHGCGRLVTLLAAASPLFWTMLRYGQLSGLTLLLAAAAFVAFRRCRPFTAGLTIGCLAFKPQFGVIIGFALLAGRNWRTVAGALVTAAGQLAVGWGVAGTQGMTEYFGMLWTLLLNPSLVQLHPTEVHSWRGFFRLLTPWTPMVTAGFALTLAVALTFAARSWTLAAPVSLRWSQVVLLTVLATPHLLAYDLVLLTVPIMVLADWCVRHQDSPRQPLIALLLVAAYLSPFSGNLARVTSVQLSVLALSVLVVSVYSVLRNEPGPQPSRARV